MGPPFRSPSIPRPDGRSDGAPPASSPTNTSSCFRYNRTYAPGRATRSRDRWRGTRVPEGEPVLSGAGESLPILAALEDETRRGLYLFVRFERRSGDARRSGGARRHLLAPRRVPSRQARRARAPGRALRAEAGALGSRSRPDVEVLPAVGVGGGHLDPGAALRFPRGDPRRGDRGRGSRRERARGRGPHRRRARSRGGEGGSPSQGTRGGWGRRRSLDAAREILSRFGFEPVERDEGTITLRSCPYDRLARGAPDVVCGINHAFVEGVLRGLGAGSIEASLEPTEGECCVRVRASG